MEWVALVVAVVAFLGARAARKRIAMLEAGVAALQEEVRTLRALSATGGAAAQDSAGEAARPAEAPSSEPVPEAEPGEQSDDAARPAVAPAIANGAGLHAPELGAAELPPAQPTAHEPAIATEAADGLAAEPSEAAPPALVAPPAGRQATLEERLGAHWTVWLGGLALALGGVLLVRYSIEQGMFSPLVRVSLGGLFSLVLVAAGEWFRRSERASTAAAVPSAHIPSILTAAGTISAFGTAYAAHALYQFIGPAAAFIVLGAIAIATLLAAALHGQALAGLGLAGALVVPLLVASQAPNPWPVVVYLAVVAGAAYTLAHLRGWLWLTAAVVAGALVWTLALLGPVRAGAAGDWTDALFVHVGLQLALAALYMGIVPHRSTAESGARPDWMAALALAALAALAIRVLQETGLHPRWEGFALAVLGVLALTAWLSAPAAAAAVLAGIVALAAMAIWHGPARLLPDVAVPAPGFLAARPRLLSQVLENALGPPDDVARFLALSAACVLAIAGLATLRVWRGRALPLVTVGLYALAAVLVPLLALVLAYLRAAQLDRSIPFALAAAILAATLASIAYAFHRRPQAARTPAATLLIGAFGSGAVAAVALGLLMALDRGYFTVALAITAFATALFAVSGRVPMLRYVVVAVGLIVLGRLIWDPRIMGAGVGTTPILNWLLLGYGVPAAAFLAAGRSLGRQVQDLAARLCDALGVLFAALLVFFQIRHAIDGGDPLAPTSSHIEQGLFALMSIAFAAVLIRMDIARGNPVFRVAALIFGVASGAVTVLGLGLVENPLLNGERVLGPVVFSSLLLAYLVPGLAAAWLARIARGARPAWYVNGAAALSLLLSFGYVGLELRHAFHGADISDLQGTTGPELGLLVLASLVFAATLARLHALGIDPAFRQASVIFGGFAAVVAVVGLGQAENPLLSGEPVLGPVGFSSLLPAYLLPALGAAALAWSARGVHAQWFVNGATGFAVLLLFGYAVLEVRHAFHGEILAIGAGATAPEAGVITLASLVFAAGLVRLDCMQANPVFRELSLAFGGLSAVATLIWLGLMENPLLTGEPVAGPVGLSSLVPAYLLPALGAVVLVRTARGVRPDWYVGGAAALALALVFGYVTLEVRHGFQGERLSVWRSAGAPEVWSYSVAWLVLGLVCLGYGLWRGSTEARLASAVLVVLSVLKVFLYDLTGIGGFWRAFSVICLGAVLIGIGLVYQKLVFARPPAPPAA